MAQTSIGFNGSISAVQWAQNAVLLLSNGYGVGGVTECAVTQVTGQRAVSVAAGRIGGDGIVTTLSAAETVALPTPTNGQWYLLVLNRKWSDGSTSLMLRNGPTTAAASSGTVPASYPASMTTTPGTNADVAVAWLWANLSSTTVSIVPILRPHAATVPRRGTAAQRDALFSGTGSFAARKYLQDMAGQWFNTETSNYEAYYAEYDATLNPTVSTTQTAGGWVAVVEDTGWINETLIGGNTGQAKYRRKNGVVYIIGSHVPTTDNQILFRLPSGSMVPADSVFAWQERGLTDRPAALIEVQGGTGTVIHRYGQGTGPIRFNISFIPRN